MSRARTNPRLFIRYLHWGVYAGIPGALVGAAVTIDDWTAPVMAATVAVAIGLAGVEVWAWWVMRRIGGGTISRAQRRLLIAAAVAVVAGSAAQPVILGAAGPWFLGVGCLVLLAGCVFGMLLRLWQVVLLGLGIAAAGAALLVAILGLTEASGFQVGFWIVFAPGFVLAWWTTGWMLRVMNDLQEARDHAAAAAVNDERARISRDLHDLFGQTLSAIAVKSELAAELATRGRVDAAVDEMRQVHQLADESGGRVRAVVRGERVVDFAAEVDGARSLLAAAQVVCTVDAVPVEHPDIAALAWVLRESVTNILRHSNSRAATITVTDHDDGVRLRVANDAVSESAALVEGGGLAGMRQRLADVGGTLTVDRTDGWFSVTATLPSGSTRKNAGTSRERAGSRREAPPGSRREAPGRMAP